ncbi:MAG: outer membrane protein assembly factor BamB [Proteobacteria bacterium]|nr:outer membrane protein assembly factor BamB [Pseudomonadota bacterium]
MSAGAYRWWDSALARLTGAALLAGVVLAGCAAGSARPKPAELPPNNPLLGVRLAWTAQLTPVNFPLQVNVLGNRVSLAASDGTVLTLDAATGSQLSRASVGAELSAGVGSDGQVSAVITRDNEVVALQDARELWRHRLPTQSYTAPLVAGGRVFVLGADRSVRALDGRGGALLWTLQRPAEPLVLRQAGVLMAVGNTLVAGMGGRLAGIDPDIGSLRWEVPLASPRGTNDVERLVDLVGGVYRQGNLVCARAFQATVGCVDTVSGTQRWSRPAAGNSGVQGDEERVYGAESDGTVMAWRVDNGDRAWSSERLQWRQLTGPLALGRSVVVGDETGLVHLLARDDGSPVTRLTTDGSPIAATPVAAANTLIVVTRKGGVFGFVPD